MNHRLHNPCESWQGFVRSASTIGLPASCARSGPATLNGNCREAALVTAMWSAAALDPAQPWSIAVNAAYVVAADGQCPQFSFAVGRDSSGPGRLAPIGIYSSPSME